MKVKRILLSCFLCAIAEGNSSPSEEHLLWSSVSYKWTSYWDACTKNRLTINRNKQISVNQCGKMQRQVLNNPDFAEVHARVNLLRQHFRTKLKCYNEVIMDYAVSTYLRVGDETKKMYQFNDEKKCSRGERLLGEQLQKTLEAMHSKYVPASRPTEE